MIVAVGSKNKAKISACERAVHSLQNVFFAGHEQDIKFRAMDTRTSVPDMPLNQADLMKGALQRALFVYDKLSGESDSVAYAIGLEGGVCRPASVEENGTAAYLQNWVYAYDGTNGFFGSSAAIPLPRNIVDALYEEKRELAEVIDELSGKHDVRSNEGAFGILTRNLLTRSQSFETAIINALVPFYNKDYYQPER